VEDLALDSLLDLLEKAKNRKDPSSFKENSSVNRFIREWDIGPGKDRIPTYIIFYTYRVLWDGINRLNKTNKINFFRTFAKHFEQVRTGKNRYYLLDGSKFDMSRKGKLEAKHYEQTQKKFKETLKQKRKRKISKSKKRNKFED
jgi:hypothetical protein